MGVPPAKRHEKLDALGGACFSLPAGRQAGHAWFFDPVGMGLRPAKRHEKLDALGGACFSLPAGRQAGHAWFFEPVSCGGTASCPERAHIQRDRPGGLSYFSHATSRRCILFSGPGPRPNGPFYVGQVSARPTKPIGPPRASAL